MSATRTSSTASLSSRTRYLRLEDLLTLAEDLAVPHIRDPSRFDSAAQRPQSSLFGRDAFRSLFEKAAVLLESIVRNHPLVDGNTRLGWLSTVVFLGLNAVALDDPDDAATSW